MPKHTEQFQMESIRLIHLDTGISTTTDHYDKADLILRRWRKKGEVGYRITFDSGESYSGLYRGDKPLFETMKGEIKAQIAHERKLGNSWSEIEQFATAHDVGLFEII